MASQSCGDSYCIIVHQATLNQSLAGPITLATAADSFPPSSPPSSAPTFSSLICLPSVLLVGAPKAGTTHIAATLMDVRATKAGRWAGVEARPEQSKEPRGLLLAATTSATDAEVPPRLRTDWTADDRRYSDLFHRQTSHRRAPTASDTPVVCPTDRLHTLDASVQYLYAGVHWPGAGGPVHLAAAYRSLGLPLPRVLVSVRDPVARVQSDVRYQRLGHALDDPVACAASLHVASTVLRNCVGLRWHWGPQFSECVGNWTSLLPPTVDTTTAAFTGMLRNSVVDVFIDRYAAVWPAADMLVVSFDEWRANTTAVLSRVLTFLEVDADPSAVAQSASLPVANVGPTGGPSLRAGCRAALKHFFASLPRPVPAPSAASARTL